MIRLQKFLAEAGVASRRASEKLIADGHVKVNGRVVKEMGVQVDPSKDVVHYNNKVIRIQQKMVYYMLNKPKGYITSASDEKNRKVVFDLLDVEERLFSVGRLDQATSGMLILTNDGDLTYKLTHPKHEVEKTYIAEISPKVSEEDIEKLRSGVTIDGYKTSKCKISKIRDDFDRESYKVVIHEGKNRQIRKMFEVVGSKVINLKRTRIGTLQLDGLKRGQYRPLTKEEVRYLKEL